MHLKAIKIKEELLGPEDYEVGLSIGHLASLYNYHMNMHRAAEKLYLRSISISKCTNQLLLPAATFKVTSVTSISRIHYPEPILAPKA